MSTYSYSEHTIGQTHSAGLLARILDEAPEGTKIEIVESSELRCRLKVTRPDRFNKPVLVEYSLAEALAGGCFDDDERRRWWKQATTDCLYWACVRRVARRICPDFTWADLDELTTPPRGDVVTELAQMEGH